MKILRAEFEMSAFSRNGFPRPNLPEVAFAGRSNVGKSSLINTLVNRKHLVKVSSTPGKTRSINFFNVNGALRLVDLPGYGYAQVPVHVRQTWKPLIEEYLLHRSVLSLVILILDIRRDFAGADLMLLEWLQQAARKEVIPVFTKADKISFSQMSQRVARISNLLGENLRPVQFSSKTGMGKDVLWSRINEAIASFRKQGGDEGARVK